MRLLLCAVLLYAFSCTQNEPPPKQDAANLVRKAIVLEKEGELEKAVSLYELACKKQDPHACGSLGMMRFYGHGIHPDAEQGLLELRLSCDANYGEACTNLGIIYALGRWGRANPAKAEGLFEKGCRLQSALACSALKNP